MSIPALTTQQMAEVDRRMIEDYGIQLIQMMENAGRSLADTARRLLAGPVAGRTIAVLCGTGNNGGGGLVAARHLHNRGAEVQVRLIGQPAALKPVPAHQWRILQALGLADRPAADLGRADLIVDALIGYGLTGDPRGPVAEWIRHANAAGRPILSLDAPSGLDTTSGAPGQPCIRAAATLTLALPKTGLLASSARAHVGDLFLADIGVPPELYRQMGLEVGPLFEMDPVISLAR